MKTRIVASVIGLMVLLVVARPVKAQEPIPPTPPVLHNINVGTCDVTVWAPTEIVITWVGGPVGVASSYDAAIILDNLTTGEVNQIITISNYYISGGKIIYSLKKNFRDASWRIFATQCRGYEPGWSWIAESDFIYARDFTYSLFLPLTRK